MTATVRESPAVRVEKVYEKYAWILFLVLGFFVLIFSLGTLVGGPSFGRPFESRTGVTWDQFVASNPRIASYWDFQLRSSNAIGLMAGLFVMAISLTSYRRGERWAWYALWTIPAITALLYAMQLVDPQSDWFFGVIALIGLLLPYRKFFPGKPSINS